MVRLQKFLAEAGVASRRAAELLISSGDVSVNGKVITTLGTKVDPDHDRVTVRGAPLRTRKKHYIAVHKPAGCICSRDDPEKRASVYDLVPPEWRSLFTVGRLDFETEGLIFLTNDGNLSERISHPRHGIRKRYVAMVTGRVEPASLAVLVKGVIDRGEKLKAGSVSLLSSSRKSSVIELELSEGKNREVRRMLGALGLEIIHLRRIQIGSIKLGELPSGRWRVLQPIEVKSLLRDSS